MKKIELLLGISNIILNADDTNTTLQKIARFLKEAIESDVCSIYLLGGAARDRLVLAATEGLSEGAVGSVSLGLDEGLTGLTYTNDHYTFIRNATTHERFHYFPGINEEPYNTFIGIPLRSRAHEFGVLVFQFRKNKRNTDMLRKLLRAVAAQVSGLVLRHYLMHHEEGELVYDSNEERIETGVPLSSGIAFGEPVIVMAKLVEKTNQHDSPEEELEAFNKAIENTRKDLEELIGKMDSSRQQIASNIFETHLLMLNDITFRADIELHIKKKNKSASFSVRHVADKYINRFRSINDAYLRERAQDVEDIAFRLLSHLGAVSKETNLRDNSVIFADRLTPGETATLDLERVCSFVTEKDGVTSHTAILAKSMKIPAVTGVANIHNKIETCERVIVDGYEGHVIFNPSPETVEKYKQKMTSKKLPDEDKEYACRNFVLKDGSKIKFYANVSSVLDSEKAELFCADGIGLVRTEIFYLGRDGNCSLEQRMDTYRGILRAFPHKPVVFRLLDIGSDKKSAYEAFEDNPALGNRGVRLLLTDYQSMLEDQLTALIRLHGEYNTVRILVPFVADANEYFRVKKIAEDIAEKEGLNMPDIGVMLEIPSLIYQLDQFKGECAFFSIGTNDMFQYFFALDRGNPKVSSLYRPDNQSFINLLKRILDKSNEIGIPVEICGEMAADPEMLTKLIDMGYREFSVSPYAINELKYHLHKIQIS
ncbi:PTSINtr with GAF domain, PtsP [Denitrovibrio acetiphilus DSM 12809]|uniref:Phosphoenolpyruvate-protein phosphotransferase n=1 Tax=Denitrovibrio acetiphilus (strain DSM 12809 / NBRC 114555 / N2460) TaxID=522772 RepID=D4H822_DENA2|nr:phosphoenolpyruvate--protein phosphotransferase [Denitrovibrio acetiphilus]ADD68171.1 PTSINtr with GAF domain, PtsP [Denitrovibrio acetiphilus DSM 12809]